MKKTKPAALKSTTDPLCELYEQLRGYVLEDSVMPGQVYGLGVMLQQGMRAWIEATSEYAQVEAAYGNVDSQEDLRILSSVHKELARMLASIVLNPNQKERF